MESITKPGADTPLKVRAVAPLKLLPVIVTADPMMPLVGVNEVMLGMNVTTKLLALAATPATVVMLTAPVVAPGGTLARNCVGESNVKIAATPLSVTELTLIKFVPVTVINVPTGPIVGLKEVMVGGGMKVKSLAL